jgi:hypothetical protein
VAGYSSTHDDYACHGDLSNQLWEGR